MAKALWFIIWLVILLIFSFWIAGFIAFFYIILYPITVCIPDLSVVTDFLLKCIQFPKICAENMMEGKPLF
ncbi:CLUMA_CG001904, isoform A [Clunio marinus]|uniref:CLUMA_CG001904, isoform A n=1 Tax=Clunio marinus TaxID=568069 RepID=A0A1J1HJB6_9DIPT|nr:CLUMA_CG001904, isoform A [Clunio marinus]